MYNATVEPVPDDYSYRNRLIITDDENSRDYWDGGEPEDNSFNRDWSWVKTELLAAYEQGRKDARLTGEERAKPRIQNAKPKGGSRRPFPTMIRETLARRGTK